jgi:basic membrane protein A
MAKDVNEVAARFPLRHFAIIDAVVDQPNVASVTFKEEDGSFLAGAAAAMASKTHQIAFLGGIDIPLLRKFEVGFTAGAREIDPAMKVAVKYVGSFDDAAAGKELSGVLFDQGADVVFVAAGKAGIGAIDQVKTRPNDFIIGVDSDQDALAPGKVLTSMVKRVDVGVFRLCQETVAQKLPSGHLVLGLKENGVGLTAFTYTRSVMTPARIARINRLRAAIIAGTITPPATREELALFKPVPVAQ